jgi:hypothetical protein
MDSLGINAGLLLTQFVLVLLMIGLPLISLIDLSKEKLNGTPLAVWLLVICAVPFLGSLAYWIVRPTAESRI